MVKKQDLENKAIADQNEIQLLLAEIEELKRSQKEMEARERNRLPAINHLAEMQQLRARGSEDAGAIKYKDIHDHKNIRLWHTTGVQVGRSIGPIHPANAEETFQRFMDKGIVLSIQRPSQETIDRYKETDEYKSLLKIETARREGKKTMSRENSVDKLTAAVAKLAGIPIENTLMPNAVTNQVLR